MRKLLFILGGIISLLLGIVGIFVPGLPTTPFVLLSSWLFYKSSKRMHDWLHRSWMGNYIRRYEEHRGMSKGAKLFSILCMWVMISISAFLLLENLKIRILLIVLGVIGTCCVSFIVPSANNQKKP